MKDIFLIIFTMDGGSSKTIVDNLAKGKEMVGGYTNQRAVKQVQQLGTRAYGRMTNFKV